MKIKESLLILLLLVQISNISSQNEQNNDKYKNCVEMMKKYQNLHLNCNLLITNSKSSDLNNKYIIQAFANYKNEISKTYNTLTKDKDYQEFITLIQTKLKKRQNLRKESPRLLQIENKNENNKDDTKRDFSYLLDIQRRNEISQQFLNTISDNSLIKEMKNQYNNYNKNNYEQIYKNIDGFYYKNLNDHFNDQNINEAATNLQKSIQTYIENNIHKYKQTGIITPKGTIENNPGKYINTQEKLVKDSFANEKQLTLNDLEKIMQLN